MTQDTGQNTTTSIALFSATIFLSAALVFAVQPMLGKMLLPLVGGSPSGWLTALAFFQVTLLAGYYVAHLLSKLTARRQMGATLGLLVVGGIMLPPQVTAGTAENVGNIGQVLLLLTQSIGIPYLALSTVSSGLQRLYAAQRGGQGGDPYFLYAASNAGSFIGLLTYPILVEPLLPLSVQSEAWGWVYALLLGLIGMLLLRPVQAEAQVAQPVVKETISLKQKLNWLVLAFIPSSLSMGLTALITADMGSLPLFWVVPLGLYLLTFVVAFGAKRRSDHRKLALLQLFCMVLQIQMFVQNGGQLVPGWIDATLPFTAFVVTALLCHRRLADSRPAASGLTEFYLWLALGGALGGVFNAFLAPLLFPYPIEFVIVLCASVMFAHSAKTMGTLYRYRVLLAVLVLLVVMGRMIMPTLLWITITGVGTFIGLLTLCKYPQQFGIVGIIVALLLPVSLRAKEHFIVARNFFGMAVVIDRHNAEGDVWRILGHGSTIHGIQRMTPQPDHTPQMNFSVLKPLFAAQPFTDVGVVGLGAGIVVCFDKPDRHFTIYEIDPLIKHLAMEHFTYIKDCGEPRWHIGDGRVELVRDREARYDMIMIDAFSSGSIPSHLLTREALDVYMSRLKPDGIIVLNINNRYYDFFEPLAALAQDAGWQSWRLVSGDDDIAHGLAAAHWALLAPGGQDMRYLEPIGWEKMPPTQFPVWHDEHANILGAMRLFYHAKTH